MTKKLLKISEVCELTGVSRVTIWRWIKHNGFPKPVHLSDRVRAWPVDEVEAWIEARSAERG